MLKKQTIWIAVISIVILYLTLNLIYYFKFHANGVSSSPEQWGQYGDFIGGSLNPILAIANIIALVYLTYTVSHIEDNRAKENINAQKVITLNQMRHDAVKDFSKVLDNFSGIPDDIMAKNQTTILTITIAIGSFGTRTYHLFEKLFTEEFHAKYYEPLRVSAIELSQIDFNKKDFLPELEITMTKYTKAKNKLIAQLNKFIISEFN